MKFIFSALFAITFTLAQPIYDLEINASVSGTISFEQYRGRYLLIVNTASQSPYANQLGLLQSLHEQYGDKVSILVCPSNSFGREPLSDIEIQSLYTSTYNAQYHIAATGEVSSAYTQYLYQWLTDKDKNGSTNSRVSNDFQKYLIDGTGNIVGIFSAEVSPTDSKIINLITTP